MKSIPLALIDEQLDVLRRIADRGLELAHERDPIFVDLFQHVLDETARTQKWISEIANRDALLSTLREERNEIVERINEKANASSSL